MKEAEVLKGTALLVLGMSDALLEESRKLPRVIIGLFQRCYRHTPARSATNIVWADRVLERPSAKSPDAPEELAVIEFATVAGVRHMLTNTLEVVSKGQAMGLELRRGYIKLGPHRLLVEGVVQPETPNADIAPAEGPHVVRDPQPKASLDTTRNSAPTTGRVTTPAATTTRGETADDPTAYHPAREASVESAHSNSSSSSLVSSSSTSSTGSSGSRTASRDSRDAKVPSVSSATAHHASGGGVGAGAAGTPSLCLPFAPEPRVVFFALRRLYVRPDTQDGDGRDAGAISDYPVSPYLIFELVRTIAYPRKILVLPTPSDPRRRLPIGPHIQVVNVLVEFASAENAAKIIETLNDKVVEFMSYSSMRGHAGRARTGSHPQVEVRFAIQVHVSFKKDRTGAETVQKQISLTGRNDRYAMIVPPIDAFDDPRLVSLRTRLTPPFPRKWVDDIRGPVPHSGPVRTTSPPRVGRDHDAERARDRSHDVHESKTEDRTHRTRAKRSRSPEVERDRHQRRAGAEGLAESSSATTGTRAQHRSKRSPSPQTDGVASAASRFLRPPTLPGTPSTHITTPQAAHAAAAVPASSVVPAPHAMAAPTVAAAPPPPPLMADHLGALPFGWRPIFSQEYQQMYYAYRDPATGVERTTWTRPSFESKP